MEDLRRAPEPVQVLRQVRLSYDRPLHVGHPLHIPYGPRYGLAPAFLSLYVVNFLYAGFGLLVVENFFNGTGQTRKTLKMGSVSASVLIPSALLLALLFGVSGLIASFLASSLLALI